MSFDPTLYANAIVDETCRVAGGSQQAVFRRNPWEKHKIYVRAAYYLVWKGTGWTMKKTADFFGRNIDTIRANLQWAEGELDLENQDLLNAIQRIEMSMKRRAVEEPSIRVPERSLGQ